MSESSAEREAEVVSIAALTREATFRRLAELVRRDDAVPPEVVEAARASFAWRSVDDELAALVYDSDRDGELLANVRATGRSSRMLTFEAPGIALEVEVSGSRPRELVCQVVPPQAVTLELLGPGGVRAAAEDDFGTFHFPSVPPGAVKLRCRLRSGGSSPVATSWVQI